MSRVCYGILPNAYQDFICFPTCRGNHTPLESDLLKEYHFIETKLELLFKDYHEHRKARLLEEIESVVLRENAAGLCSSDYTVTGTPITGDQGGDLIVNENGKTCIIQAKG